MRRCEKKLGNTRAGGNHRLANSNEGNDLDGQEQLRIDESQKPEFNVDIDIDEIIDNVKLVIDNVKFDIDFRHGGAG